MTLSQSQIVSTFANLLGADKIITGDRLAFRNPGYCRHSYSAGVVLTPETTADVAAICAHATECGVSVVAHGGLTGLVEGTATTQGQVAVSFERMNKILRVDPLQGVAIVQAGVVLADVIAAAKEVNLQPGVTLPSRGGCTLGGMTATNAGGVQAIRYGMMRDNILGLTAVLADGRVLDLMNCLVKNNAGYDLKQIFIGSEGTLGLITEVVIKLHAIPDKTETALVGCDDTDSLFSLLGQARSHFGGQLLSFEVMWPEYFQLTTSQPGFGPPLMQDAQGVYAILETGQWSGCPSETSPLNEFLARAYDDGHITDGIVAQSEAQRSTIWRAREDSDAVEIVHGACLSYDVGMELCNIPEYIRRLQTRLTAEFSDLSVYIYGHLGDGNLHVTLGLSPDALAERHLYDRAFYDILKDFQGTTISAEHGIGLEKKEFLPLSRTSGVLACMAELKRSFDPENILNPGKIL